MALTSDIQRALQDAIGEANNAFSQTTSTSIKKKKKKKRARDITDGGESQADDDGRSLGEKKKKKKQRLLEDAVADEDSGLPTEETTELRKKKKSKKKGKEKQNMSAVSSHQPIEHTGFPPQTVYTQNPFDLQVASPNKAPASTAAFLSALVTAASEETQQQQLLQAQSQGHQPVAQYDHSQQQAHPHYMPFQIGYPYQHPPQYEGQPSSSSEQQQHSSLFPTPMGVPLNELANGSNEDILRALQDLDMSKIANVLKTLGEAAAAANVPHHPQYQPAFLGGPSTHNLTAPPPPPLNQVPSTAGDILLHSTSVDPKLPHQMGAQQVLQQPARQAHNRVLDMSLPGPEQQISADHAWILANKWLNAAKLAEMVKTQGK